MKYITEEDLGPSIRLDIDESQFGMLETIGMIEDVRDYIKNEKRTLYFNHQHGGSIDTDAFLYNDVLYFSACDNMAYGVNLSGERVWGFKCPDIPWHPVIDNDVVYFGCYDGNLYAVTTEGRLLWKFPTRGKIVTKPVIEGDTLYLGSEDRNLYAVSKEGKLRWKFRTGDAIVCDAVIHGNMILLGSMDGNLYAMDKSGNLVWRFTTGYALCIPVVYKNKIYVGSYNRVLYALTLEGREIWRFEIDGMVATRGVTVYDDVIYIGGSIDNNLYAINLHGKLIWKQPADTYSVVVPVFHNKKAYLPLVDGSFIALDARTGRKLWTFRTGGPISSTPVIHNRRLYFGSWDCNFYCLDLRGNLVWKYPTSTSRMARIDFPENMEKKVSSFMLKPQELKMDTYKTTFSIEGLESEYTSDTKYKAKSEYRASGRYGK